MEDSTEIDKKKNKMPKEMTLFLLNSAKPSPARVERITKEAAESQKEFTRGKS